MKRQRPPHAVHLPGLLHRLVEWVRGHDQLLVRGSAQMPLLLLSYPREGLSAARQIELAYNRTWTGLSAQLRGPYEELWPALPAMVIVLLRARNACGCLGHHHPPGTESRLARRLAAELGHPIAEIDLAYQAIRDWQPEPLAWLGVGVAAAEMRPIHFQAGALAVLMHEMEHLAFPGRSEREVRARSRQFYTDAMRELVAAELGGDYGVAWSRPL